MYRGRFAPSPTGPLHFGSLVAAVGSFLEARSRGGQWLLRMEDLDTPRTVHGASDNILRSLEAFGMAWDGSVLFQRARSEAYRASLDRLHANGAVYFCACTRREIADSALHGIDGPVYPGTCRSGLPPGRIARATRMRTAGARISFEDEIQGAITQDIAQAVGDFVVHRADGLYAYQLAVVVDDAAQGITHVVRGADLLDSTPRQIWLQQWLEVPTPRYAHLPVAVNALGEKLSKQTRARALDLQSPALQLAQVLHFLGHRVPQELQGDSLGRIWAWALEHWNTHLIPQTRTIHVDAENDRNLARI